MGLLQEQTVSTQVCPGTRHSAGRSLKLGREIWSLSCCSWNARYPQGVPVWHLHWKFIWQLLNFPPFSLKSFKGALRGKLKNISWDLTSVAQLLDHYPAKLRSLVWFPVRAHAWVQVPFPVRMHMRQPIHVSPSHLCFSPSPSPSLQLSQKIDK